MTQRTPDIAISETPAYVGRAVAAVAADRDVARWNGQLLSSGQLAKVYGFTDLDASQPDAWCYMVEVQEAGRPSDVSATASCALPSSLPAARATAGGSRISASDGRGG